MFHKIRLMNYGHACECEDPSCSQVGEVTVVRKPLWDTLSDGASEYDLRTGKLKVRAFVSGEEFGSHGSEGVLQTADTGKPAAV